MAHLITDKTGEIQSGSIYLPQARVVPIGQPVVGVAIAPLKEELTALYGDRFEVVEVAKTEVTPEAKPPARKKPAGGEVKEGENVTPAN
jgi:hypothetical protein